MVRICNGTIRFHGYDSTEKKGSILMTNMGQKDNIFQNTMQNTVKRIIISINVSMCLLIFKTDPILGHFLECSSKVLEEKILVLGV